MDYVWVYTDEYGKPFEFVRGNYKKPPRGINDATPCYRLTQKKVIELNPGDIFTFYPMQKKEDFIECKETLDVKASTATEFVTYPSGKIGVVDTTGFVHVVGPDTFVCLLDT